MNEAPEYTKSEVDSFVDEIYTYEEINFLDVTFTNAFLYSSFPITSFEALRLINNVAPCKACFIEGLVGLQRSSQISVPNLKAGLFISENINLPNGIW